MALRKRHKIAVGSPSWAPGHHSSVGGDGLARLSVKFVLLACAVVLVLLILFTNMEISINDIHISYG